MDLLNIQPNKVSRDLSGYITFIYGKPKAGKTTLAAQMDGALILAFERGYNALPGVRAVDIVSWPKMKEVIRELKRPEVQQTYKAVVVDTVDVAADMCQKYICQKLDIESLGDVGFGQGWIAFKDEFNTMFRGLTQLGYAVFFIGHDKEEKVTDKITGQERINIRPSLAGSVRQTIEGLADIYGYAHQSSNREDKMSILTLRCPDDSIACGGRFKYIAPEINPMSYDNLVKAMNDAIDKEAAETNGQYITNDRIISNISENLNFDNIMKEFNELIKSAHDRLSAEVFKTDFSPKLTEIIETTLGRGKKMSELNRTQVEPANLVLMETKELLSNY